MTHPNVPEPSVWLDLADELEKIAHDLRSLVGEPAPACFNIIIQPRNPDPYDRHTVKNRPKIVAAVDAIALALLGKPSTDRRMSDGTYHRDASGDRGAVNIATYTSVADPAAVDPDEEIARLRAENAELRAAQAASVWCGGDCTLVADHAGEHELRDPLGHRYSREDDGETTQPVAMGRVEMHTGGMVDGDRLVDESDGPVACSCDADPLRCEVHGSSARASLAASIARRGPND